MPTDTAPYFPGLAEREADRAAKAKARAYREQESPPVPFVPTRVERAPIPTARRWWQDEESRERATLIADYYATRWLTTAVRLSLRYLEANVNSPAVQAILPWARDTAIRRRYLHETSWHAQEGDLDRLHSLSDRLDLKEKDVIRLALHAYADSLGLYIATADA